MSSPTSRTRRTGLHDREGPCRGFAGRSWSLPLPHSARGRVLVDIRLAALLALVAVAVATPGFFTTVSLFSLLNTTSFIGCVAIGMTFITLSGNIMSFALGVTLSTSGIVFIAGLPLGLAPAMIVRFRLRRRAYRGSRAGDRLLSRKSHHRQHGGLGAHYRLRDADHSRAAACIPKVMRQPY